MVIGSPACQCWGIYVGLRKLDWSRTQEFWVYRENLSNLKSLQKWSVKGNQNQLKRALIHPGKCRASCIFVCPLGGRQSVLCWRLPYWLITKTGGPITILFLHFPDYLEEYNPNITFETLDLPNSLYDPPKVIIHLKS